MVDRNAQESPCHVRGHNFALETIQMPSFGGFIRLGVLHVTVVVAVLKSTYKGEKPRCEFGLAAGRPGGRPPGRQAARAAGRPGGRPAAVEAAQCLAHDSLRCPCSLYRDGGHRDGCAPKSWASESSPVQSYDRLSDFQRTAPRLCTVDGTFLWAEI